MNNRLTSELREFTQVAKQLLAREVREQLEGIYGLLPGGKLEPAGKYPAMQAHPEAAATRTAFEAYLENERAIGVTPGPAYEKLVKEAVFTWLNRLVAFKMMEKRGLLRQTISRGVKSNGFLLWLTEPGHEQEYEMYAQGDMPQDLLGEGPRQKAYRLFLVSTCRDLAGEASILFDPGTLVTRLFPRPRVLQQSIDRLNEPGLEEVWQPGSDETIGWVYQYFIQDEKEAVFDKIYRRKKKIEPRDLPAATQIFTPRWIVGYLVQNTLGRLWLRLHPDSALRDLMEYYVPNDQDRERLPLKKAGEITLLDPACGTMHFGMTAFDLFHAMYLEEIENQGRPGWPGSPSVPGAEDIPQAIVENNIYGIDIDLRAIQLSALSLYLKAKTRNKDARLTRYRLTCTDIPTLGQDMIQTFVDSLETGHRVSKKLLLEILPLLNKAYYLGSLLKVEEVVEQVVEKERVFFEDGHQPALFAEFKTGEQKSLDLYYEKGIDWSRVRQELAAALSRFSEAHPHTAGGFLAGESVKGLGLIDALIRKHDVVVGNPPYSGRRNWNDTLSTELKKLYDKKSGDFYTCFIDRCIDLTEEGGFTGMITVHSFMFTSSHEPVREKIIRETAIETMAHLGTRSFEDLSNPNAQGFVMYALRKSTGKFNDESRGVYFRLVKELSISEKEAAFQRGLADLNSANVGKKSNVYILPQEKLKVIPTWPFVYWLSEGVRNLFEGTLMGAIADIKCGMTTSDNFRFLRLWWELGNEKVDHSQKNIENFKSNLKWFPYMKGGEVRRWYGNQDYIVNWKDNGKEIKNVSSFPRAMQFYFKEGSTYSFLTISNLSVRYLPSGFLFDMAGSSIFPKSIENYLIIGILNSKVYMYLIKTISPTVSYQVGDLARIPIPWLDKNPSLSNDIIKMVKECIDLKRKETQFSETSWEFLSPIDWREGIYFLLDIEQNLALLETGISKAVYNLYEIEPCDIEQIEIEFGKLPGDMPQKESLTTTEIETLTRFYLEKHIPAEVLTTTSHISTGEEEMPTGQPEPPAEEAESPKRGQKRFLTLEEICLASGLHPETVYRFIVENRLEREEERTELAYNRISYAVGIVMGRFQPGIENALGRGNFPAEKAQALRDLVDPDAILVMDEGHKDDLALKVLQALTIMVGEKEAGEIVNKAVGKAGPALELLRRYLGTTFFKRHIQQYRKRPVYWFLQSPQHTYGVWLYHERITKDTLFRIRTEYVEPKKNFLDHRIAEISGKKEAEKRDLEKALETLMDMRSDVLEFKGRLENIIGRGYMLHPDDGVLLNMAPLWELIPSWSSEPKKAWEELEEGKYDWSYQAMDHWPGRVKEKSRTDRSLAIAHGLV